MTALDYSELFEAPQGIYLLSHSVGCLPRDGPTQLDRRLFAPWRAAEGDVWQRWLAEVGGFCRALAALLNSTEQLFCPQTNVSSGLTKIVGALPAKPGRRVLLHSADDFPTVGYVLQAAARLGYEARAIPRDEETLDPDVWQRHLSDDVRLVLVTHVQSNTGRRVPVPEILAAARARGVVTVVDVAQSVGVVPIDLQAWHADFVVGSSVKWLCGGPGAAFLWVHEARLPSCKPADVGWFSHEDPFEFDIQDFRYHPSALRFWGGTPSVAPMILAAHSITLLHRIGIETVARHNRSLCEQLITAISPERLVSPAAASQRGGTVIVQGGKKPEALHRALSAAQVRFDGRATGIRLSPHLINTEAQIETVRTCLQRP